MIYFLSPLPPKQTGTADYIMQLLFDLECDLGSKVRQNITLLDKAPSADGLNELRGKGWLAEDISDVVFCDTDVVILFLASNEFHRWVWEVLAESNLPNVVAVVHDLTAFPMLRSMARDPNSSFSREDEILALQFEFGMQAEWMADNFDNLPETSRYFLMGQGITLSRADIVVVHSKYAQLRLVSEAIKGVQLPTILVYDHPRPRVFEVSPLTTGPAEGVFCVGSIGFYSDIKRNEILLEAFGAFARSLSAADRARVELVFVGKIDGDLRFAAEQIIERWQIKELVRFTGYVEEEVLQAWQNRIDLQMNLRFPSCGETSGTLARAQVMGKRVVCSSFAAFHEENATWKISVDPLREFPQLLEVIEKEFLLWRDKVAPSGIREEHISKKLAFSRLVSLLLDGNYLMGKGKGSLSELVIINEELVR
ncbi:glycosyltransferase [Pseudomonas protegens]|uniref:glycosyltransferase n=1 Tax=Pseudomonas protegens TaxID=380021 RepID=UPI0021CAB5AD|nr:glycosyltransferase [Pseudomonas protegens]MCU1766929.1 glycosyltransferase [Pseudomonas protegens]